MWRKREGGGILRRILFQVEKGYGVGYDGLKGTGERGMGQWWCAPVETRNSKQKQKFSGENNRKKKGAKGNAKSPSLSSPIANRKRKGGRKGCAGYGLRTGNVP